MQQYLIGTIQRWFHQYMYFIKQAFNFLNKEYLDVGVGHIIQQKRNFRIIFPDVLTHLMV